MQSVSVELRLKIDHCCLIRCWEKTRYDRNTKYKWQHPEAAADCSPEDLWIFKDVAATNRAFDNNR